MKVIENCPTYSLQKSNMKWSITKALLKTVPFANDQAMIANSVKGLQRTMHQTNKVIKKYEIELRIKKTSHVNWEIL